MKKGFIKRTKSKIRTPDKQLIIIIFILIFLGLILLVSASSEVSRINAGNPYYYLFRQLLYGIGIGLILFFITQKVHYSFWRKQAVFILMFCIFLLALVFVPQIGISHGGSKRWINLGFASFQPSELVKLGFIIYLAAWLEKRKTETKTFSQGVIPFLIIVSLIGFFIILQPDVGTLGAIALIGLSMFWWGGAKMTHVLFIVILGIGLVLILVQLAPYRMNRIIAYLNPNIDPLGIGYQSRQASLAIGSGGLFGLGPGHSRQKFNYLPSPQSDSIFAIAAEEYGFIGASTLIFIYLFLTIKGLKIAKNSPDRFASLTAAGISFWIFIQAFINIGAVSGLIPLTGITLPLISYGSSSMISLLAALGILVNISKYST